MRLLRQNLSLVAGDCHLATSLSRSLEVAKQSSSVYRGRVPLPPSSQSGVSSTSKRLAATPDDGSCRRWSKMFLQTMWLTNRWPGTWRILGYLQHGLVFRHLRSLRRLEWALLVQRRPKGVLLADYSSRQETHLARRVIPKTRRVARGVSLLPAKGDLETLLTPQESPREWFSSPQEAIWRLSSPHKSRQGSDSPPRKRRSGDSPQRFSDYSSRQATLLGVSRTTRLARWLSSEFLGLLVSPGDSPQRVSDYSSHQESRNPPRKSSQGSDTPPLKRLRL